MSAQFGIALGSTPNAWTTTYAVAFDSTPKAHPQFPVVLGRWSPNGGQWKIIGYSHIYGNGPEGLDIRSGFARVTEELEQTYDHCEELDYIECKKLCDPKTHMFSGGAMAEPTTSVCWTRNSGATLPDGMNYILLMIETLVYPEARICLTYAASTDDFELQDIL